jgi:RimJ/RimL family protein N-acetyltransferase
MTFSLLELSTAEIETLAASCVPASVAAMAELGAMPPAFVTQRALALAATGVPSPWATIFLIVDDLNGRIVGACGFKIAPRHGRVEVGYGVAPVARGKGAATAALGLLVQKAYMAGATEVLAEVAPDNHASTRVVQKAGFAIAGSRLDDENEYVIQWLVSRKN